jgi:hypothetical protein
MELRDLSNERFDIGRSAILRAPHWDGTGGLVALFGDLEHIGTTEGPVDIEANEEYSDLTIEVTGPAILKRYLSGESPSFEMGVFPDPEKMALFSPTGSASAGSKRRRQVLPHTLWIVPEELFLAPDATGRMVEVPITFAAGAFLKDGDPLTADEQDLVDMSILVWKAQFGRMTPRYSHEDGGKSLKTVPVQILQDLAKPDGAQLYMVMAELETFGPELVIPEPPVG